MEVITMNKTELVNAVAEKAEISKKDADKAVAAVIDAVIDYLPAPTDIEAVKGTDLNGNEVERKASDDEPFSALAFKVMTDPFVGYVRFFLLNL